MDESSVKKMVISVIIGGLIVVIIHLYNVLWLRSKRLRSKLEKQGIKGPSPSFLVGNIPQINSIKLTHQQHNHHHHHQPLPNHYCLPSLFPHLLQWQKQYGPLFVYSVGSIQHLCIVDVDMVKELNLLTSSSLGKPSFQSRERGPLLGKGIFSSSGPLWEYQRKIIAPEFYPQKVKAMLGLMVDCTKTVMKSWETIIDKEGGIADLRINDDLRSLSADVISRACFGSNYLRGKEIFSKLNSLQTAMSKASFGIPFLRHLPSKINREIWKLEKEINSAILSVVEQRMESKHEKDLLQMILEGATKYSDNDSISRSISKDKFIVDNCKSLYFGGHETTATSASWCLMLLAAYPDWQTRARAEVLENFQGSSPNADMLPRMKTLTMVIQEMLRLYPPATLVAREALHDLDIKGIIIPKGTGIQIPVALFHQDPDLWGPDAHEFNPERFSQGICGACKNAHAYIPFGIGGHICAGQNLAMIELKVILSLMLSKFHFSPSPSYQHCPALRLVLEPAHGVSVCVRKI